jgi:hypothetical protein
MEQLVNAELKAFKPREQTPFLTVSDALQSVEATETAQDAIDSVSIGLEAARNPLSDRITSRDRLEFSVQLAGEATLSTRLVAIARDVSDELTAGGGVRRSTIEATDFVFTVLSFRVSDAGFTDTDVGNVVNTLVGSVAPEVGRSQIETVGRDISISINGRKTLDVLSQDLAPAGDAVVAQDGTDLIFRPLQPVSPQFDLSTADLHTPITVQRVDDELINRVRIDGGVDSALDDEQPTQNGTVRVDDSTRQLFQVASRKSELSAIELFTVKDDTADSGLVVRLQAARNGSAVNPTDRESDVARRELAPPFLAENGFTEFQLPDHDLAPAENPFVIVEGVGPTGHEIGVDTTSNDAVTFRAFFPFRLLARSEAGGSQAAFRRRDLRRRDEQLGSAQEVEDAARAALRRRAEPTRRISAQAATPRAHRLRPADAVTVPNLPVADASGQFLVTERATTFEGTQLRTELTFADVDTI